MLGKLLAEAQFVSNGQVSAYKLPFNHGPAVAAREAYSLMRRRLSSDSDMVSCLAILRFSGLSEPSLRMFLTLRGVLVLFRSSPGDRSRGEEDAQAATGADASPDVLRVCSYFNRSSSMTHGSYGCGTSFSCDRLVSTRQNFATWSSPAVMIWHRSYGFQATAVTSLACPPNTIGFVPCLSCRLKMYAFESLDPEMI